MVEAERWVQGRPFEQVDQGEPQTKRPGCCLGQGIHSPVRHHQNFSFYQDGVRLEELRELLAHYCYWGCCAHSRHGDFARMQGLKEAAFLEKVLDLCQGLRIDCLAYLTSQAGLLVDYFS